MSQFGIFLCEQDFQPWGVSYGYEGLPEVATNSPALQKTPFLVVWSLFDGLQLLCVLPGCWEGASPVAQLWAAALQGWSGFPIRICWELLRTLSLCLSLPFLALGSKSPLLKLKERKKTTLPTKNAPNQTKIIIKNQNKINETKSSTNPPFPRQWETLTESQLPPFLYMLKRHFLRT